RDLDLPIGIVPVPTVREADGLAMSSRNVYLNPEQRAIAPLLYQTLTAVVEQVSRGEKSVPSALEEGRATLSGLPGVTRQYLEACDRETLEPVQNVDNGMVVLVAAKFGDVRLIDNVIMRNS